MEKKRYPSVIYLDKYSSREQELDRFIDEIYESKDEEYKSLIRDKVELVTDTKFVFKKRRMWEEISEDFYDKQMVHLLEFIKISDEMIRRDIKFKRENKIE